MSSPPVLGIDLGTTNSVVAVADGTRVQVLVDPEGNRLIPSVVSFHPQGDVLVGYAARERRLLDAKNTVYSVKRLIGRPYDSPEVRRAQERFAFSLVEGPNKTVLVQARNETYTLPEISAFVLREVRRIAEQALGQECSRAVITVPANFNELQRAATKAAGKVAGLEVMRILNEPTAAALAYGYGKGGRTRERIAIYDFGGGTFDITILELSGDVFEVMSTAGDTFLGGDDVDVLVAEQMADAFLAHHRFDPRHDPQAYERLRAAAEWSKCQLSAEPEVHLRIEELAYGDGGASLDLTFGLSRTALEKMTRPLVERSLAVCDEALRIAGIAATQLDNVILVGGTTRMPLVRQMVKHYFGREAQATIDPDLVVSQGAALQGYSLRGERGSMPPSKPLGRVALKKATAVELRAQARRVEVREEIAAARPKQPAFAPREAPPLPPVMAPRPMPARPRAPVVPDADETVDEEVTTAGVYPAQSATVAAASVPSAPPAPPPRGRVSAPPLPPVAPPVPAVVTGRSVAVGERARSVPPPPPRPPPPPAPEPFASAPELSIPAFPGLTDASAPIDLGAMPALPPAAPPAAPQGFGQAPQGFGQAPQGFGQPPQGFGQAPHGFGQAPQGFGQAPQGFGQPPQGFGQAPQGFGQAPQGFGQAPQGFGQAPQGFGQAPQGFGQAPQGFGQAPQAYQAPIAPVAMEIVGTGAPAPLLLDVTPHSLGVETVGGFCEAVIKRNAAIPVEQTRVFTTALDGQAEVRVRIVQGESRRLAENQPLGEILLGGIRQAARGQVKIGVTFVMDADGTLGVRAKDLESGREQTIRVQLVGAVADGEIQRMQERQNQIFGGG
jgi:molecular chaperone DnaK